MDPTIEPEIQRPALTGRPSFKPGRSYLAAGDWLTLAGMAVSVIGASQPWKRYSPPPGVQFRPLYVSKTAHAVTAFRVEVLGANVGWIIVFAAVSCGALVLFAPSPFEKPLFLVGQTALGAVILGLAAYHSGPFWGIYFALAGGFLLIAGGALRFR